MVLSTITGNLALRIGYGRYIDVAQSHNADLRQYRLGLVWQLSDDVWSSKSARLASYVELGAGYWKSHLDVPYDANRVGADEVRQISLTPMFRLIATEPFAETLFPFLDAGVGVSYQDEEDIEKEQLSGINMGGKFQFEIRLMLGVEFGQKQQFELSYGWMHYSNAHINEINEGMDFQTVQFGYRF